MKTSPTQLCLIVAILISSLAISGETGFGEDAAAPGEFAAVASIFEKRCVSCHNDADTKGGLSLTSAKSFAKGGESGAPIEAGSAEFSLLVDYVSGDEPQMPKSGKPLTAAEVAAITKWVNSGAAWPKDQLLADKSLADTNWWSLQPIKKQDVPAVPEEYRDWATNDIDAFVLAKLLEKGLTPSPQADRRSLIRRLTYDLTGLPPSPEEVQAFVADDDPQAYEKLVDRLLASKHYGERWARHWLDVVKYADTHGYDKDKLRPNAWPYRDYVIRSFNDDKPYSRFVQEQLAGDYLYPGEPDSVVALGFLAAGPWDFIGHVEVPESKLDGKVARNLDRDDMVSNTLNSFCSVTVQCARCHNHKFDPITQKHYYSLQAVFAAVDRADRPYESSEDSPRYQLTQELAKLETRQRELAVEFEKQGGAELVALEKKVADLRGRLQGVNKGPEFGYHSAIVASANEAKWVEVDLGADQELSRVILHPCHDDYGSIGAGFGFPVRFEVTGRTASGDEVTLGDFAKTDFPNPGLRPVEIGVDARQPVKVRYVRVTATKLAERTNDYIFALAELEVLDAGDKNLAAGKPVNSLDTIEAPVRWGRKNLVDGIWARAADPKAVEELATAQAAVAKLKTERLPAKLVAEIEANDQELGEVKAKLAALPPKQMVYAVATEFSPQGSFRPTQGKPRPISVLHRGNVDDPKEPVSPGTIPLSQEDDGKLDYLESAPEAARRAALAQWIVDKEHPLTWRSIVNRVWLYHFGQGIVASPNDFGRMGAEPTHPELLDWLAINFRDHGQSFKALHKQIVMSSTYRQASTTRPEAAKIDGSNQFLWRMNRRRLEAEEIRDAILSVSGKLDPSMGGPGFYLFALEKTAHSPHYEYHKFDPADPKSHRRSIYRFIVRSQPNPYMSVLDCADSSQSTPKRDETLTSLQALALLNNRFNLTMSEAFAERLTADADNIDAQVERAYWLVAGRAPTAEEKSALVAYGKEHGLKNLCRVMFNLSEFVYLD